MTDSSIFVFHAAAWTCFVLGHLAAGGASAGAAVKADRPQSARHSSALISLHVLGFALLYFGLGSAILGRKVPRLSALQQPLGALFIVGATALMVWAMAYFRSFKVQAKIEAGHELATGGPFAFVRHPIYAGLNLLALGSLAWVPTATGLAATLVILATSDLRARAEEEILGRAFGAPYEAYKARTKRFLPGLY